MNNKQYLIDVLSENRKNLFNAIATKKKIEYEIQKIISNAIKPNMTTNREKFNTNSYYTYFDYRIKFDEYMEYVEYIFYFILSESLTPERLKVINDFKSKFNRHSKDDYIFEYDTIQPIKTVYRKVAIEDIITGAVKI